MSINSLVEIPIQDWEKLRDLYINRKLETNSFNMIQNFINWLKEDPSLEDSVKLYSLNGDWSDGTFILIDHKVSVSMNTLEDSQKRLLAALHCLDRKPSLILYGFSDRIRNTIETYLSESEISKDSCLFSSIILHHIELKRALEFDIKPPKGITLSSLRKEDITTINDVWPFRNAESEMFIKRLVTFNLNIGAYDETGNLIAWCLVLPIGALGVLQVQDSHKRKGFGSLMVRAMAKMQAEKGIETIAPVVVENAASLAMFKRIGFQEINKIFWILTPGGE